MNPLEYWIADHAILKVKIIYPQAGEIHEEWIFAIVLPASGFINAELYPEKSQPGWIGGSVRESMIIERGLLMTGED